MKDVGVTGVKLLEKLVFHKSGRGTKGQGHRGLKIVSTERPYLGTCLCKLWKLYVLWFKSYSQG